MAHPQYKRDGSTKQAEQKKSLVKATRSTQKFINSSFYNTHKYGPKENVFWTLPLTSNCYIPWLSVTV